jgi:hypothetical protein
MKPGDLIKLQKGTRNHFALDSEFAIVVEKLPRTDNLKYDWCVFVDGVCIDLGRQIENSCEVISESR